MFYTSNFIIILCNTILLRKIIILCYENSTINKLCSQACWLSLKMHEIVELFWFVHVDPMSNGKSKNVLNYNLC